MDSEKGKGMNSSENNNFNIDEQNNIISTTNEKLKTEDDNNVTNAQNINEGVQKAEQEAQENIKINEEEGQAAQKEGYQAQQEEKEADQELQAGEEKEAEGVCEKEKNASEQVQLNLNNQASATPNAQEQYSSCYRPPYYVPNFSGGQQSPSENQRKEGDKKRKKNSAWIVVLVAIVSFLLALFVSICGFAALLTAALSQVSDEETVDLGEGRVTIVQNAPQVDIVQNTDPNYVPQTLPEVVNKVGNSVVEIRTESRAFDRVFGQYVTSGAGSGVIIAQNETTGFLLTNHHVIHNEDNTVVDSITVVLANGEEYNADKIHSDDSLDLAVLVIYKKADESFTVASFGDSSKLVVGQDVIAIGNPLGSLGGTVTDGIISALDRRIKVENVTMTLLQHNAAINPGNSGGALFDMMGNLVGIVNAKTSDSGIEGLGFAIPSNIAFDYFNRVMVIEPKMGLRVYQGQPYKNYPEGVYISVSVYEELKKDDRIVAINGNSIESTSDYYLQCNSLNEGDTVVITVVRKNSQSIDFTFKVGEYSP